MVFAPTPTAKKVIAGTALALVVIGAVVGHQVWYHLFRSVDEHYETVEDLFKFGPSGAEEPAGIPYHIWAVLPEVFADLLPGEGYASLGFTWEDGHELPIGISSKVVGFRRVATNCAFCHVSVYRSALDQEPNQVLAGTRQNFNGQRYFRFLMACGKDPRFTPEHLLPAIEQRFPDLPVTLGLAYRFTIIDRTREALQAMYDRLDWWFEVPDVGPGRWIAFVDLKYHFAKQPRDGSVGNPDVPTLWNLRPRQETGMFHWDGLSDDAYKIIQNACIGGGAEPDTIPREEMKRLGDWWMDLKAPEYPYAIDRAKAARGEAHYREHCASCHDPDSNPQGRIVAIDEIGTDRHRWDMLSQATVDGYNELCRETYGFPEEWQIRKLPGYSAVLLDGIWLRAPYLHNGSVPTLADLLEPAEARPAVFWRGGDVYDQERLGFSTDRDQVADPFRYDTSLPANGNAGHEYGTALSPEHKDELLEYLKTL